MMRLNGTRKPYRARNEAKATGPARGDVDIEADTGDYPTGTQLCVSAIIQLSPATRGVFLP